MGYVEWLVALVLGGLCVFLGMLVARQRLRIAKLDRLLRETRGGIESALGDLEESSAARKVVVAQYEKQRRVTDHLSEAIGIMQKSRDKWKDMFFVQAHEHGNGQALLERALTRNRQIVIKLVAAVNAVRKEKNEKPITKVEQLDAPPIGTAEGYRAAMKELADNMPADPDMLKERDRLLSEAADDDEAKPDQPSAD